MDEKVITRFWWESGLTSASRNHLTAFCRPFIHYVCLRLCSAIRAGLQPIGPFASNRAPRLRGPLPSPTNLLFQSKVFVQCRRGAHSILGVRSFAIENKNELHRFALNHHNSFFNRNNDHCFSAMRSLFFNRGREDKVLKLFSVSITSVSQLAGQFIFNSLVQDRVNSYCCFNSYCYLSFGG